jgi:hypothetical protein
MNINLIQIIMKKFTLLLLFFVVASNFAQRVEPTFVWTNKSDYQINGETAVTFTPGQVVSYNIEYTLGSTDGVNDAGGFFLFGVQDEPVADLDPLAPGSWQNFTIGCTVASCNNYKFAASGDYTVVASAALNSSDANLTYRVLTYRAYTPAGGTQQIFGGAGSSEQVLVYIRSQAEIDAILSTKSFNTNKLESSFYSSSIDAIVIKNKEVSGDYKIYNVMGQTLLKGKIEDEINVDTLKSGIYILTTDKGTLKFVK